MKLFYYVFIFKFFIVVDVFNVIEFFVFVFGKFLIFFNSIKIEYLFRDCVINIFFDEKVFRCGRLCVFISWYFCLFFLVCILKMINIFYFMNIIILLNVVLKIFFFFFIRKMFIIYYGIFIFYSFLDGFVKCCFFYIVVLVFVDFE